MDIVIILPAKRKTEIVKEYTMQKQRTAKRRPLSCHESYSADAYLTSAAIYLLLSILSIYIFL